MQSASTAENSVSDTSIAVICALEFSKRRDSSWHRSESAARASGAVLNAAIASKLGKMKWRYTVVSPGALSWLAACHQVGTPATRSQDMHASTVAAHR